MNRWTAIVIRLAGAGACAALAGNASAEIYSYQSPGSIEHTIVQPFDRPALAALAALDGHDAIPDQASRILSISYRIDPALSARNGGDPAFSYWRTTRLDGKEILEQFDEVAGSFEGHGCSRLRVDPAQLVSASRTQLKVRLKFRYTARTCSDFGTHDVSTADGEATFAVDFAEERRNPVIHVRELSHTASASTLGINNDNFFGDLAGRVLRSIGWVLGRPSRLQFGLYGFEFEMLKPLQRLSALDVMGRADRYFSPAELASLRQRYGDLANYLGNATSMRFDAGSGGFVFLPAWQAKAAYRGKMSDAMCTALQGGGNSGQYCQPTGARRLVIEMTEFRRHDGTALRAVSENVDNELRYLDSMSDEVRTVIYPKNTLMTVVSREAYGPGHHDYFMANNQVADCFADTFSPQERCRYTIKPLWQKLLGTPAAMTERDPLAPGSPMAEAIAAERAGEADPYITF